MNEFYALFKKEFGEGSTYASIPEEFFTKYHGILPAGLLEFWREKGWCSYADGLIWTVNPDEYTWLIDSWVRPHSALPQSEYFVVARTAFGVFYCLCLDSDAVLMVACPYAVVFASKKFKRPKREIESAARGFFPTAKKKDFELSDGESALFKRALTKLGPVGQNEIYGFVPIIPSGGTPSLDSLQKVRMDVHIDLIRQTADPVINWN
jgi:hypothetical protein